VPRIAFIGAGSLVFSRRLMIDILTFPDLRDSTFALVDIDPQRLDCAQRMAERIVREGDFPAKVEATADRREALKGADYVIIMILVAGIDAIRPDIEIPLKYGVDQCVGDTLGPGGVLRALRTVPVIIDICRDMEELCPDAWLLNYTNPMAMLCWAMNEATAIKNVGLCHSVQGTAWELATIIRVRFHEVSYWVAGINHQAWFLEYKWRGEDAYPRIRERMQDPLVYRAETVRAEMLKHLGYFVTESSGHNSEYTPWFRKRPDLLKRYTGHGPLDGTGMLVERYSDPDYGQELERIASGQEPIAIYRSDEYASHIINSLHTGQPCRINGNVRNDGLITNLPQGACVEVPCFVDKHGINPCFVGDLPPQCAALNRSNIAVQEMAVKAALSGDRRLAFHAVVADPLTAAVLSLEEIQQMVDEMFAAEARWLPQFT
jgi:alpha-galactosidase